MMSWWSRGLVGVGLAIVACGESRDFPGGGGAGTGGDAGGAAAGPGAAGARADAGAGAGGNDAGASGAPELGGAGAAGAPTTSGPSITTRKLTLDFNRPIRGQLAAKGGDGELTWSVAPGSELPDGVTLEADGTLSGRAVAAGDFSVEVVVEDEQSRSDRSAVAISVVRSKRWLAYIADHETFGKDELYVADITQPAKLPKRVELGVAEDSDVQKLAFSPDGTRLACIVRNGAKSAAYAVDPSTAKAVNVSKSVAAYSGTWTSLAWSPSGTLLAFSSQTNGAPDYHVAGPVLDGTAEPRYLADFGQSVPALDVRWISESRVAVISSSKFYEVSLPMSGAASAPEELLVPNLPATLPSPPTIKTADDPALLFFYVGDFNTGSAYLADFRQPSASVTELGTIPYTGWQPSPDGEWLLHREFGSGFSTTGPTVQAVDGSTAPFKKAGTGEAFWGVGESTLFWTEAKTSKLMFSRFGADTATEEHLLSPAATIVARADDNLHLLLKSSSNQHFLWSEAQALPLETVSGTTYSFAPYAGTFAYVAADAAPHPLRVGRTLGEGPETALWSPAPSTANVTEYAWAADGSVVFFRAKQSSGEQLYRADVISGKPMAQTVHSLRGCLAADKCPAVKSFVLQP